uniref:Uncharacterized protein n=1 Tax=Picea glauca TaxID=3330 RepID=A0A117NH91_PICGL|nr:hypothetical protein ABT39_MTgene5003 [Picea glauca]QHR86568.1 hypothetical protein Q903MT_gene571 [Picea sitchensis]
MDLNMLFHPDDSLNVVGESPLLESGGPLMIEEEEEPQGENIFLQDEEAFDLSPAQPQMVSDNIMAEVRIKYELRPRLNAPNFRREEVPRGYENIRREEPKVAENTKRQAAPRASD